MTEPHVTAAPANPQPRPSPGYAPARATRNPSAGYWNFSFSVITILFIVYVISKGELKVWSNILLSNPSPTPTVDQPPAASTAPPTADTTPSTGSVAAGVAQGAGASGTAFDNMLKGNWAAAFSGLFGVAQGFRNLNTPNAQSGAAAPGTPWNRTLP